MKKKQKHNIKSMFLKGLLQSFFIVVILLGAGVLGYNTTMKLWMTDEEAPEVTQAPESTPQPITTASVDDISKNLIYCYDGGKITGLVLEIFHCEKKQMTYITIPLDTQFTMSDTLYKKLIVVQPATPQIIRLSSITRYFEPDLVFDYGVLILEDMLKLKISYYTVVPQELYDTIFSEQEIAQKADQKNVMDETGMAGNADNSNKLDVTKDAEDTAKVPAFVFTDDYRKFMEGIKTEEELKSYIEDIYPSLITNLSLQDKMNYLESYVNTQPINVTFERLPGKQLNSGFILDEIKTSERLSELTAY